MTEEIAALGQLAALLLLWRFAPGGWPSLAALVAILAPVGRVEGRRPAPLSLVVVDVLVVIGGTLAEVLSARSAEVGAEGLVVALARGLLLAGAAGSQRALPGTRSAFVTGPVGFAVLCAGTFAGSSTTAVDVLCAVLALTAAFAGAALAHDERTALLTRANRGVAVARGVATRRPVFGLSVVQAALSLSLLLVAVAAARDPGDRAPPPRSGASPARAAAGARAPIGLSPEIVFDGSGAPEASDPVVVAHVGVAYVGAVSDVSRPTLHLRATALERLEEEGFRRSEPIGPPEGVTELPPRDLERIDEPRGLRLEVDLRLASEGFLLTLGSPRTLEGTRAVLGKAGDLRLAPGIAAPLAYTLLSDECADDDASLQGRAAGSAPRLLELPASLRGDEDLAALAARITRGAVSPHGRARAIERALVGDYDYDVARSHRTRGVSASVRRFLLEEKRGACTEFATAMVVLLRLSGVPARLAIGYLASPSRPVFKSDAHAWVEVPLEGAGFVTYDPTAPARASAEEPVAAAREDSLAAVLATRVEGLSRSSALALALGVVAFAGAGGALRHALRAARRHRARVQPRSGSRERRLLHVYAALFALVERRGFVLHGSEPLLAFAQRRAARGDAAASDRALVRAVRLYYAIRFSGRETSPRLLARLAARIASARQP